MKLQYILTILMVSLVLGGCMGSDESLTEVQRHTFSLCMINVLESDHTAWDEATIACRAAALGDD